MCRALCFFCFKQKTAYEMRISDWSSDVCSSDLGGIDRRSIQRRRFRCGERCRRCGEPHRHGDERLFRGDHLGLGVAQRMDEAAQHLLGADLPELAAAAAKILRQITLTKTSDLQ